ncbi:MAG: DUF4292 domain-containing protein [Bacteroidota bacterium]
MRSALFWLPLAALLMISLSSCKDKRPNRGRARYKGMDQSEVLRRNAATELQFRTALIKGKAEFDNPAENQTIGFTYRINIAKDSLIVANITKLGFPGAMMRIDRDSVKIRLPLDKTAMRCDLSFFSEKLGFEADLESLQDILLGDPKPLEDSKLIPGDSAQVELRGILADYEVSWFLNGGDFKLEKMAVKDRNLARTSVLEYSDFQVVSEQTMPFRMNMEVTQSQPVRIELKHSNVNFDHDKTNFRFRIPASYEVQPCRLK